MRTLVGTTAASDDTKHQFRIAGVLRQWWTNRQEGRGQVRQMKLIETLSLGGKRELMLVQCGDERFLVGGGMEQINTIVRLGDETLSTDRDGSCE
jgi:flagellar biogenesis protein FliO